MQQSAKPFLNINQKNYHVTFKILLIFADFYKIQDDLWKMKLNSRLPD